MDDKRVEALGLLIMGAAREELGRVAYEAYRAYSDGKSLIISVPIPPFEDLAPKIRAAWTFGAVAVQEAVCEKLRTESEIQVFKTQEEATAESERLSPDILSNLPDFQILPSRPINVAFSISLADAPIGTKVTHLGADGSRTIVEVSDPNILPKATLPRDEDVPPINKEMQERRDRDFLEALEEYMEAGVRLASVKEINMTLESGGLEPFDV